MQNLRRALGISWVQGSIKTHPPLQTTTKTSPFSRVSYGSGKRASFGAGENRAGDEALLCKHRMWQWNEELQRKRIEEWVSRGTALGAPIPWRQRQIDPGRAMSSIDHTSSHRSKWALTETPTAVRGWVSKILKGSNDEKKYSFISVQHHSVLQDKLLATGETLHP